MLQEYPASWQRSGFGKVIHTYEWNVLREKGKKGDGGINFYQRKCELLCSLLDSIYHMNCYISYLIRPPWVAKFNRIEGRHHRTAIGYLG